MPARNVFRLHVDEAGGLAAETSQGTVFVNGELVMRIGDKVEAHGLAPHSPNPPMITGAATVFIGASNVCGIHDLAQCCHEATTGSPDVFVGGPVTGTECTPGSGGSGGGPGPGCTNPHAANYNPDATEDDGSCLTCASQGLCVVPDPSPCKGDNCNNVGNGCCDEGCLPCTDSEGNFQQRDCSPSFDHSFTAANGTYYPSCYG